MKNLRFKTVQIKKNRRSNNNENYSQPQFPRWMRVILNETLRYSVPDISKAVFSISKNDQVSAATRL